MEVRVLVAIPYIKTLLNQRAVCCLCNESHSNFIDHMKSRHADPVFLCGVCGSFFESKEALHFHMINLCRYIDVKSGINDVVSEEGNEPTTEQNAEDIVIESTQKTREESLNVKSEAIVVSELEKNELTPEQNNEDLIELSQFTEESLNVKSEAVDEAYSLTGRDEREARNGIGVTTNPSLKCDKCSAKFNSLKLYKQHLQIHKSLEVDEPQQESKPIGQAQKQNPKPYECKECGAKFSTISHLKSHQVAHSDWRPFSCKICDAKFKRSSNLKAHHSIHTGERPFECENCKKTFRFKSDLKVHMRVHRAAKTKPADKTEAKMVKKYACTECEAKFCSVDGLKSHKKRHSDERPFSCQDCSLRFKSKSHLDKHHKIHTDPRPYSCNSCSKTFRFKAHLRIHLKSHSTEKKISHGDERAFACDVCNAKFKVNANLEQHRSIHTGEKPHICESCGKAFRLKCILGVHLKSVHGIFKDKRNKTKAPVRCSVCSKLFTNKTYLKLHLVKHTNEINQKKRIFQCHQCGVSFSSCGVMNRHVTNVHLGVKPFKCLICSKAFNNKHNLKSHESVHTGERPHACEHCGKCFRTTTNLYEHLRNVHKETLRKNGNKITLDSANV